MTRVKRGVQTKKRHKKVLKAAKGYRGKRSTTFKLAKIAVIHARVDATRDRKLKKRTFRSLWIIRLNAAVRAAGMKYSTFIKVLKDKNIMLNRKVLSNIAAVYPEVFKKIVDKVK